MEAIAATLSQLEYWHWLALGAALLMLELATGTTYILWPAAAALAAGLLVALFPMAWPWQIAAFAGLTLGATYGGRRYIKGKWLGRTDHSLNDRGRELAGQRGVAAVDFQQGAGRVRHGDTEWRAESRDAILAGDTVEITGVEGASLIVKKVTPAIAAS